MLNIIWIISITNEYHNILNILIISLDAQLRYLKFFEKHDARIYSLNPLIFYYKYPAYTDHNSIVLLLKIAIIYASLDIQ